VKENCGTSEAGLAGVEHPARTATARRAAKRITIFKFFIIV